MAYSYPTSYLKHDFARYCKKKRRAGGADSHPEPAASALKGGKKGEGAYSASSVTLAAAVARSMSNCTTQYSFCSSMGVGSSAQLQPAITPV